MKKSFLAAALIIPAVLFAQDKKAGKPFTIEGKVAQAQKPAKVFLRMRKGGENVIDSAQVVNGQFTFTGTLEEPTLASLMMVEQEAAKTVSMKKDMLAVYLDKGTISVSTSDSISKATVKGSPANDAYLALNNQLKEVTERASTLQKEYRALYQAKDEEGMKKLEAKFDELESEQKKIMKDYLKKNRSTPIGMYVISQVAGYDIVPAEIEPSFKKLSKEVKNSPSGKEFAARLKSARKTAVGQPAITFSQATPDGKMVNLADYRGKYVLVDFWASWCGPCRQENPNVVKAYEKFKEKGFDILGVSLDDNKDKWLKAVDADKLAWTHVSDLKGWKNAAADLYGVRAIPQNVLIDPKGKIVAKNLRGDKLEEKLAELMK
jgi:peroxiredoxin